MRSGALVGSPLRMLVGSLVIVALVVVYLALVHRDLPSLLLALGFGQVPLHDYQHFFQPMGERVLHDPRPVEGFLYGPWAALCLFPFGLLPYSLSAWLWAGLLLLLTAGLAHEAARFGSERGPALALLGVALTLSSFPLLHDLKFGQVSVLIVWLLCACATLHERGSPRAAAACLAFAASFKAYPALFLGYFVLKRDWRFVRWALGFAFAFSVVVPVLVLGARETWAFYGDIANQLDTRFGAGVSTRSSQSLATLGDRLLLRPLGLASPLPRALFAAFRYALCAGLLFVLHRLASRPMFSTRLAFLWLFLVTPFVVATSWPHYFVYLPLAVVATLAMLSRAGLTQNRRRFALAGSLIAALLSNIVFFDALGSRKLYNGSGLLFVANLAALVAFAAVVSKADSAAPVS